MREHCRAMHTPFQYAAQKYGEQHKVFIMKTTLRDVLIFFHSVQLQLKKKTLQQKYNKSMHR